MDLIVIRKILVGTEYGVSYGVFCMVNKNPRLKSGEVELQAHHGQRMSGC
jgi:hypothetical protein